MIIFMGNILHDSVQCPTQSIDISALGFTLNQAGLLFATDA